MELSQEVMSAHAGRTRHVQIHNMAVTAIKMTMYGVKTAVYSYLPVKQLRFGDTGSQGEEGYHTLGKFKCR